MPRAVKPGTNQPADFSPIYATEEVPLSFDFSTAMVENEIISGNPLVVITLIDGIDSTPSSRLLGFPGIVGTNVVQWVGTCQEGAVYDLVTTIQTNFGQILTTNARMECQAVQ